MCRQSRDRLHAPTPILKQMMTAGLLGRKTGRGFYTYDAPDSPVVMPDETARAGRADGSAALPVARDGVVGSGTMATGIVEGFAKSGFEVRFFAPGGGPAAPAPGALPR